MVFQKYIHIPVSPIAYHASVSFSVSTTAIVIPQLLKSELSKRQSHASNKYDEGTYVS